MSEHWLKISDDYLRAVVSGDKTFEVRVNDRGFQKGDTLMLCGGGCDNRTCRDHDRVRRTISYVYSGDRTLRDDGGLVPGWVVLGLEHED